MRKCPVCQDSKSHDLLTLEYALFDDLNLSGSVQVVQCHLCGMVYNRSILTENDYLDYYRKNDYYLKTVSSGSGGFSEDEQLRYRNIAELIEPHIGINNPLVLDFGCGKGGMLQWLGTNHRQWQLCGVEASQPCRQFIETHQEFPVYSSLKEVQEKMDVIILSHVLEHLYFPEKILVEMRKLCHAQTIIYIEVPLNRDYLCSPVNWQQLYFEHINHFGSQSLRRLLSSCAFNVLHEDKMHFLPGNPATPVSLVFLAQKNMINKPVTFIEKKLTMNPTKPCRELMDKVFLYSKPVSIWGMSQYTQLLLGTYPELIPKIKYLFDNSAAKTGRTIRGLEVTSSLKISCLGKKDLLLIPKGQYANEMLQQLNSIHYEGKILQY